jgi:hypothetical protein
MEPKKVGFESTDITFHSRDLRPTQSFERAHEKALAKGSNITRVYGIPRLVMNPETKKVYFGLQFSPDITKRIQSGELKLNVNVPIIVDDETQKKMTDKEKRRLKNSTQVWRADS